MLPPRDSLGHDSVAAALADTLATIPDSAAKVADSLLKATDSTAMPIIPNSPSALTSIVHYKAADSIAIDINKRKAQLYNKGVIEYDGMELTANDIRVDFNKQTLSAQPVSDTNGKPTGRPFFKQGDDEYMADTIVFNYNTHKGLISGVITQQGDGFLHGSRVKKVSDSVMYLNGGQYTTCNYNHPHFAINFTRSKLITGDKIFTGPAYVTIEDIPTPLVLPFAFFPMSHDRTSGILMPSYGWMNNRGYYLKDGGYYFAINDNIDLSLIGEIYTNLSWAAEAKSNYYVRYKYKGNFDIRYGITKEGIPGDSATFQKFSDFKIEWKHEQDAKANPHSRFSANVNLQSRNYNKNTTNRNDYFNSTTTSSISYTAQLGSSLNFAASLRESYNAQTGLMNIKLPSLSLTSSTFYPLRRKEVNGAYRWYENISLSYSLSADNNITAQDSDLFKLTTLNRMQYGLQHTVPLSLSIKVLKYFNWTNSVSYNERWHWSTIRKHFDTANNSVVIDTVRGFRANREVSFTSSLSTRIYGMFNFKYGPLKAIRHVINPSVSFNYHPDFGNPALNWWQSYTDNTGYVHRYSIFEQSLFGGPPDGQSGRINFSVGNNLEIKVADKKDTVTGTRKVTLLENLNLNMSYDLARDSLRWSDLVVSGRTTLFKKLVPEAKAPARAHDGDEAASTTNSSGKQDRKNSSRKTIPPGAPRYPTASTTPLSNPKANPRKTSPPENSSWHPSCSRPTTTTRLYCWALTPTSPCLGTYRSTTPSATSAPTSPHNTTSKTTSSKPSACQPTPTSPRTGAWLSQPATTLSTRAFPTPARRSSSATGPSRSFWAPSRPSSTPATRC